MGELVERYWEPRYDGISRVDRRGGHYEAFVPDPLCGWEFAIPAGLAADIADAEGGIRDLNSPAEAPHLEGLARFLLRSESVGSSWIEGLAVGSRRLAVVAAALERDIDPADRLAAEVAANIEAMETALEAATSRTRFSLEDLLAIHRTLMRCSPTPALAGTVREDQNWIGGSSFTPLGARFVPPRPEHLPRLLADLIAYVNGDDHSPLVQAAVAHAQFETIHPFGDGNGRTGRALIHVVLARRGLAPRFVPPVSVVLARQADSYIAALQGFAQVGPTDSPDRQQAAVAWLDTFAAAILHAVDTAAAYDNAVAGLHQQWRQQVGPVRRNSSVDRLLRILPGTPVLTVGSASTLIGVSPDRVGPAINTLATANILAQRNLGKQRYRIFEAPDVLDLYDTVDADLAAPLPGQNL